MKQKIKNLLRCCNHIVKNKIFIIKTTKIINNNNLKFHINYYNHNYYMYLISMCSIQNNDIHVTEMKSTKKLLEFKFEPY